MPELAARLDWRPETKLSPVVAPAWNAGAALVSKIEERLESQASLGVSVGAALVSKMDDKLESQASSGASAGAALVSKIEERLENHALFVAAPAPELVPRPNSPLMVPAGSLIRDPMPVRSTNQSLTGVRTMSLATLPRKDVMPLVRSLSMPVKMPERLFCMLLQAVSQIFSTLSISPWNSGAIESLIAPSRLFLVPAKPAVMVLSHAVIIPWIALSTLSPISTVLVFALLAASVKIPESCFLTSLIFSSLALTSTLSSIDMRIPPFPRP